MYIYMHRASLHRGPAHGKMSKYLRRVDAIIKQLLNDLTDVSKHANILYSIVKLYICM